MMAVAVIDDLEMIEVTHDDGQTQAITLGTKYLAREQLLMQIAPIEAPREMVVHR